MFKIDECWPKLTNSTFTRGVNGGLEFTTQSFLEDDSLMEPWQDLKVNGVKPAMSAGWSLNSCPAGAVITFLITAWSRVQQLSAGVTEAQIPGCNLASVSWKFPSCIQAKTSLRMFSDLCPPTYLYFFHLYVGKQAKDYQNQDLRLFTTAAVLRPCWIHRHWAPHIAGYSFYLLILLQYWSFLFWNCFFFYFFFECIAVICTVKRERYVLLSLINIRDEICECVINWLFDHSWANLSKSASEDFDDSTWQTSVCSKRSTAI